MIRGLCAVALLLLSGSAFGGTAALVYQCQQELTLLVRSDGPLQMCSMDGCLSFTPVSASQSDDKSQLRVVGEWRDGDKPWTLFFLLDAANGVAFINDPVENETVSCRLLGKVTVEKT